MAKQEYFVLPDFSAEKIDWSGHLATALGKLELTDVLRVFVASGHELFHRHADHGSRDARPRDAHRDRRHPRYGARVTAVVFLVLVGGWHVFWGWYSGRRAGFSVHSFDSGHAAGIFASGIITLAVALIAAGLALLGVVR
jgi:hypothetical protein